MDTVNANEQNAKAQPKSCALKAPFPPLVKPASLSRFFRLCQDNKSLTISKSFEKRLFVLRKLTTLQSSL